jgi:hypothetical protein
VIGYKGFDKNLRCGGFQYEIGGEYQHDGEVVVCEQGFHFCEKPLDVLNYYAPGTSRFAKVEGSGDTDRMPYEDSKVACSHLKVVAELTLRDLIQADVKFVAAKGAATTTDYGAHAVTADSRTHVATTGTCAHAVTTGFCAHAVTTGGGAHAVTTGACAHAVTTGGGAHAATMGPCAHATTTGSYAHAATTGGDAHAVTTGACAHAVTTGGGAHAATMGPYAHAATTGGEAHAVTTGPYAHAAATGRESIAAGLGIAGRAKGALGCWLVLAEYKWTKDDRYQIAAVKAARVDGEQIKPDTWYMLKDGEFIEAEEEEA